MKALLFVLLQGMTGAAICPFTRHGRRALLFVLLQGMAGAAILDDHLEFLILRINEANSSQPAV